MATDLLQSGNACIPLSHLQNCTTCPDSDQQNQEQMSHSINDTEKLHNVSCVKVIYTNVQQERLQMHTCMLLQLGGM